MGGGATVNINTLPRWYSTVSEKSVFPTKACSDVSRFILSRIFTSDPNPTALSDVYRLFTTNVYLAIQVACFDAIFDCITNMIGRLFNLHIVKSTQNNQAWEKAGFLDLYSDVNVTFNVFICDPSREKGRVGCHTVKFTFSAF